MDKRLVGIGLIGAIIVLVGIFTPWGVAKGSGILMGQSYSFSAEVTGWSIAKGEVRLSGEIAGESRSETVSDGGMPYPYLALAGGVLVLAGAIGALAFPQKKILVALLTVGGILVIIGAAWGFLDIETGDVTMNVPGLELPATASYCYGLYLCMAGGILGLIGAYGARR